MEEQEEVFKAQMALAVRLERAVSIHVRGAWGRLLELLDEVAIPERWMVHCFGGSLEVARVLLRRGAYLSFSGTVTRVNNRRAVEVLPEVPFERLLVETDAPDLLPRGATGPLNEPANVVRVVERVAEIRGESVALVADWTLRNAQNFFLSIKK
jgi:TatD DNase family protein